VGGGGRTAGVPTKQWYRKDDAAIVCCSHKLNRERTQQLSRQWHTSQRLTPVGTSLPARPLPYSHFAASAGGASEWPEKSFGSILAEIHFNICGPKNHRISAMIELTLDSATEQLHTDMKQIHIINMQTR
jgi:hypothetical protein